MGSHSAKTLVIFDKPTDKEFAAGCIDITEPLYAPLIEALGPDVYFTHLLKCPSSNEQIMAPFLKEQLRALDSPLILAQGEMSFNLLKSWTKTTCSQDINLVYYNERPYYICYGYDIKFLPTLKSIANMARPFPHLLTKKKKK